MDIRVHRSLLAVTAPALVVAAGATDAAAQSGGRIFFQETVYGDPDAAADVRSADARSVQTLASGIAGLAWSSDGSRVAFHRGRGLYVSGPNGENRVLIATDPKPDMHVPLRHAAALHRRARCAWTRPDEVTCCHRTPGEE